MKITRTDFPKDFFFGAANSSDQNYAQTRAGVDECKKGEQDGDHLNQAAQDLDQVRDAGFDGYRFSVRWAQILPEGHGQVNPEGLDEYDRLADALLERGIRPCATLHQTELPAPLTDLGGWRNRDIAGWFADFTELVMGRIGDRMYSVAPIHDPASVIRPMLAEGNRVSNPGDERTMARSMHHVLLAHGHAIEAMRGLGMSNLGATFALQLVDPTDESAKAKEATDLCDALHNRFFLSGIFNKAYPETVLERLETLMPRDWHSDFDTIGVQLDWCGVNLHSRKFVAAFDTSNPGFNDTVSGLSTAETGSGITPAELTKALTQIQKHYTKNLPIFVTETNLVDAENQQRFDRTTNLEQHLKAIKTALTNDVPVKGCFLPSLAEGQEHAVEDSFKAVKAALAKGAVSLPLAQPAGSMHEHWNLVADIGGTNTRLGVVSNGILTDLRKYPTGTLTELLDAFHSLRDEIGTDPRAVVAAGAGPVRDGTIRLTNANLNLSETDIGRATGAQHTFVINDFTAAAWSVAEITGDHVEVLQGQANPPAGTRLVVGPGTGLGVGALLYSDGRYHTASGEGGHIGLSPRHEDEVEIFRAARHIAPDCFFDDTLVLEAEMFLSGTGLPVLYQAAEMASGKADASVRSARDILEDARSGTDPIAVKAAHMFTTHLGAVMGDLAVVLIPTGGVFLVGGVAEKNRWLFKDAFCDAFNAGGRFSELRRSFNLYVSEQDEFGIVGANNFCKSALTR